MMQRAPGVIALLGLFLLIACGPRVPPAKFGAGLPRVAASPQVHRLEHAMFQRLNRDRNANGLPSLKYDERLADVARYHSTDMRDHKFFEHESPTTGPLDNRLNRAGYLFGAARENLSEAPNIESSQDGLLKSPGHYANIMAPDMTHVGIGIVQGGVMDARNLTVTQVFARPSAVESPQRAEQKILQSINQQRAAAGLPTLTLHPLLTKLAKAHSAEVDPNDGGRSLESVGKVISEKAAAARNTGLRGVMLGGQLLVDSASVVPPRPLVSDPKARLGMAVRQAANEVGRPMLHVLFVIGL